MSDRCESRSPQRLLAAVLAACAWHGAAGPFDPVRRRSIDKGGDTIAAPFGVCNTATDAAPGSRGDRSGR